MPEMKRLSRVREGAERVTWERQCYNLWLQVPEFWPQYILFALEFKNEHTFAGSQVVLR
jgi:hypothetical protein